MKQDVELKCIHILANISNKIKYLPQRNMSFMPSQPTGNL